jgi:hypothetical protein
VVDDEPFVSAKQLVREILWTWSLTLNTRCAAIS